MRVTQWMFSCMVLLMPPWAAQACRCAGGEPTVASAFLYSDVVLQAMLLNRLSFLGSPTLRDSAKILRLLKGCEYFAGTVNNITIITTSSDPSACGVERLQLGTTYFLSGYINAKTNKSVSISSCGFQTPWSSLSINDQFDVEVFSKSYPSCTCAKSCGSSCCKDNQFCSQGKCRNYGSCANNYDCWNPENKIVSNCEGFASCNKRAKKCTVNCKLLCPNGKPQSNCVVRPCDVNKCNETYVTCVDNYCSGCHAIFYNASGYHVCTKHKLI